MSKSLTDIRSLARSYTEMAIQALAGVAQNGQSESAKVAAAEALLSRGWGKPAQPLVGGDDDDPAIRFQQIVRTIVRPPDSNG
jgi:hypothetical protein